MSTIRARYLNGDDVSLASCATINDIRVGTANLHDIFAPDVTVLSVDAGVVLTDDDGVRVPDTVCVVLIKEAYDAHAWQRAVLAHAHASDAHGVKRALSTLERDGYGGGDVFCSTILLGVVRQQRRADAACVHTLITCGASPQYVDEQSGVTALLAAAHYGQPHALRTLLQAKADVNHADATGSTALIGAAQYGHMDVAHILIHARADIDRADAKNNAALIYAAGNGHIDMAHLLIEAMADINRANEWGDTPLLWAAGNGQVDMVHLLVHAGADVTRANLRGETPLTLARRRGHGTVARVFARLEAFAHVREVLSQGCSWLGVVAGKYANMLDFRAVQSSA
eukprot:GEMP01019205.1.p1 GENE.GEMP01019205.1~~GEMP01019205.1.p1  ORF type:complete len:341 (+),score=109.90 GEMP01019205.1:180-1202(+)